MKLELPLRGRLEGRILIEALNGGPEKVPFEAKSIKSEPAGNGQATRLNYQVVGKKNISMQQDSPVDRLG